MVKLRKSNCENGKLMWIYANNLIALMPETNSKKSMIGVKPSKTRRDAILIQLHANDICITYGFEWCGGSIIKEISRPKLKFKRNDSTIKCVFRFAFFIFSSFFLFFLNVKRSAFVFASTLLMFIFWWLLLLDPKRIWFLNGVLNASFLCSFHFEAYRMVVIFCYKEHVWFWIRTGFIIFYKFFILFPWFRFLFSLVFEFVCAIYRHICITHINRIICVFSIWRVLIIIPETWISMLF